MRAGTASERAEDLNLCHVQSSVSITSVVFLLGGVGWG